MSNDNNVPALERAHLVFMALLSSPWPLGISELARHLDLSKSTVHGLVHTMVRLGLLEQDENQGRGFKPATAILDLWTQALVKGSLAQTARPLLEAFTQRHELTSLAGYFLHGRVLVVEAVLAPGFGISAYAGQMLPVWAGALGKLLLATLPPKRARALAPQLAAYGPLKSKAYQEEVEQARASGVALDREEYLKGVRAMAAAVPPGGPLEPLGAVWAVGLAPALENGRLEALALELKAVADETGWRLKEKEAGQHDLKS